MLTMEEALKGSNLRFAAGEIVKGTVIEIRNKEVLVDIVKTDQPRISYGKVTADFVPTLISEHVVNGRIVEERVIGKITK